MKMIEVIELRFQAQIEKLQLENDRLKAKVQRLEQKVLYGTHDD